MRRRIARMIRIALPLAVLTATALVEEAGQRWN
jgi:hypothetical protein